MMKIDIPGSGPLEIEHLVLDFNGTLACDGALLTGAKERLQQLAKQLNLHVITADTFGSVAREVADTPCQLAIIPAGEQTAAKAHYIKELEAHSVVAIGNGRNDQQMLKTAALGIAIIQQEGAATAAVLAADVVVPDILAALDLLLNPQRLVATLRC